MRISSFTIKNYKSINSIEDFELSDKKITCLIGKNGSGKSNILHALMAIKDNNLLSDDCYFEKKDKEKIITIKIRIDFDDRDDEILIKHGLSRLTLKGFNVIVTKAANEKPVCELIPVGNGKDTRYEVLNNIAQIISIVSNKLPKEQNISTSSPAAPPVVNPAPPTSPEPKVATPEVTESERALRKFYFFTENEWGKGNKMEIISKKNKVTGFLRLVEGLMKHFPDQLDEETKNDLIKLCDSARAAIKFDVVTLISTSFWPRLTINLLSFTDYPIESSAKYSELESGNKHPFLMDLVQLTGKEIADFRTKKSTLPNNLRDAAEDLNSVLDKVFTQYKLKMEISAQRDELVFLFETPQGRVRELKDLSDGEKWFLSFYTKLAVSNKNNDQIIWLFDEPGQTLHSTGQIDLKKFFEERAENSQIVYTSHQPVMIQWHRLERIFVVENSTQGQGTKIHSRFWKDDELESPIKELLGLFVGEQMLTGKDHIVVEGISDYIHLQGWLTYFQHRRVGLNWSEFQDPFNRILVPAKGCDTIPLYLMFLADRSRKGIASVGLVDTNGALKKFTDLPLSNELILSLEEIVKKLIEEKKQAIMKKPLKFPKQTIHDIEDLYTHEEFLKEVQDYISLGLWLPNLNIDKNFCQPTANQVKNGIVKYIEDSLNKSNPGLLGSGRHIELDKSGIALHIYKRLVNWDSEKKIFNKTTEKKFEEVFKSLNKSFASISPSGAGQGTDS